MPAEIVKGADAVILITEDQDGLAVNLVGEEIARFGNLAGVSREEPASSPDLLDFCAIDFRVKIKISSEAAACMVGTGKCLQPLVVDAIVQAITEVSDTDRFFKIDDVLDHIESHAPDGIPSYQTYAVIAWLKSVGVVTMKGRRGYRVLLRKDLASEVSQLVDGIRSAVTSND